MNSLYYQYLEHITIYPAPAMQFQWREGTRRADEHTREEARRAPPEMMTRPWNQALSIRKKEGGK
jgi:hypothetical protein